MWNGGSMQNVWVERDLPVLQYLVARLDAELAECQLAPEEVANAVGLDVDTTRRSFRMLARAQPPYIVTIIDQSDPIGGVVRATTERAYRAVGAWPTAEGLAADIAAAFDRAADVESDPEQRSKLKATAAWLSGAGRSIAVDVMTRLVEHQAGFG